jgi:hypothetical protein
MGLPAASSGGFPTPPRAVKRFGVDPALQSLEFQ